MGKEKEYVTIHGVRVGRWRCPEDHRGLTINDGVYYCLIHGTYLGDGPVDILKNESAQELAVTLHLNKFFEQHKNETLTPEGVHEGMGVDMDYFKKWLGLSCDWSDSEEYTNTNEFYIKRVYGVVIRR